MCPGGSPGNGSAITWENPGTPAAVAAGAVGPRTKSGMWHWAGGNKKHVDNVGLVAIKNMLITHVCVSNENARVVLDRA